MNKKSIAIMLLLALTITTAPVYAFNDWRQENPAAKIVRSRTDDMEAFDNDTEIESAVNLSEPSHFAEPFEYGYNNCDINYAESVIMAMFDVSFETNGGTPVEAARVIAGARLQLPAAPTRSGLCFSGWYRDAGLTSQWMFNTDTVNDDLVLYARWMKAEEARPPFTGDGTDQRVTSYILLAIFSLSMLVYIIVFTTTKYRPIIKRNHKRAAKNRRPEFF